MCTSARAPPCVSIRGGGGGVLYINGFSHLAGKREAKAFFENEKAERRWRWR